MKHMSMNAMEDAVAEIAKQMRIYNSMKLLEEIYHRDDTMSRSDYTEKLKELLRMA